jgi:hypothetical protein
MIVLCDSLDRFRYHQSLGKGSYDHYGVLLVLETLTTLTLMIFIDEEIVGNKGKRYTT